MPFNLTKNEPFNLSKASSSLDKIFLGLSWDVAKSGFLGAVFNSGASDQTVDLDSSCILLDKDNNLVDVAWFRKLTAAAGAVRHGGDNRTGQGDGDDEVIHVSLRDLPNHVHKLVFTINSFTGQTLEKIKSAKVRLVDSAGNEVVNYALATKSKGTALIMAKVERTNGDWTITALGLEGNGKTVHDLMPLVKSAI